MTSYSDYDDQEDQDIDEFEDATDIPEDIPIPQDMTLERAIKEAKQAITYFFNNQYYDAKALMEPYSTVSVYHALGNSVFLFIEAILTFELPRIKAASKALKKSMQVCNRFRKQRTFSESINKMVRKNGFDQFTEEEAHAELCHAESCLLKAVLIFMEDETLSSFIKAGIKIRSCYSTFKDCQQILKKKDWSNSTTKEDFESGVKMGIGSFNLMISLLPTRVIRLLEFIGFSGNKKLGLEDLKKGYEMNGLRQILCTMNLLGYHLIVLYVLTHQEGDLDYCDKILRTQLEKHPDGVWFLLFKGRLEFMKGNLDVAREFYTKAWKSQDIWPQFHCLCFWELLWLECVQLRWREASIYVTNMIEGSKWSRTIYTYQKAAVMCMRDDLSVADKGFVDLLMKEVPKYKQRIAGKSIPMEKFVIKKSERYFNQNKRLVLPVLELMYIWNIFKVLKNFTLASNIYKVIEKELKDLNSTTTRTKYDNDNRALILLLQGACLRQMKSPLQALECLETVIAMQKNIIEDTYIVPYAIVELALIEWEQGNREKAILALEDVKNNYSKYSMESRLHFKIHTALSEFKPEFKNSQD